jgi:SAM-dependent methyltransferase
MTMAGDVKIELPVRFDWREWVERWDRMQERYLARRAERFEVIGNLIAATQSDPRVIADLGCGAGSLTAALAERFPGARVLGIDYDPTMLVLAAKRLAAHGERVQVLWGDLRDPAWRRLVPAEADAVVSATALHWLDPEHLVNLYREIAAALRHGGVFMNADHAGSDSEAIQKCWERGRDEMRRAEGKTEGSDDWQAFWNAYAAALGVDVDEVRTRAVGEWDKGIHGGLPLAWHFDQLRAAGFAHVDCFWRCDCDAIYGGVR